MSTLVTRQGPNAGRRFPLIGDRLLVGRQPDAQIYLESLAVSRQHAHILCGDGAVFIEDLGSSNGTYINGAPIYGRTRLREGDTLQIGPYVFDLKAEASPLPEEEVDQIIRATVDAFPSNHTLFAQNPTYKLQVVLEIAQQLARTLDLDTLLPRLLEQLLRLLPQADRGMVILGSAEKLVVSAQRSRMEGEHADFPYSRTIVRRALAEGVGLLSEDVGRDEMIEPSATLVSLNLRSFLCVPLIGREGRRLGVIQMDCLQQGEAFHKDDLELLTAVSLQVSVVLENAALHTEVLREERLRQEVMMARDIQQAFLPNQFQLLKENNPDLYAHVHPAREVSGDLYDFFALPNGRLAFFLGDVSGKGMPAALFMIMVRTLARHLAASDCTSAGTFLQALNNAIVADNPTSLFVTMVFGIYQAKSGAVSLAAGGHPPPLLRDSHGQVKEVPLQPGLLLGYAPRPQPAPDHQFILQPGETLILYTDGLIEATGPDRKTMFGVAGLSRALGGQQTNLPLETCARVVHQEIQRFTKEEELQDDQTLLLLRRPITV
jgi:sigma-B regulation protein RsbU (phosphoserine phosphatase)